jgi:peptide/nickel transport system permease protein
MKERKVVEVASVPGELVSEPKRRSFFVDMLIRLVREKPLGTVGGVIVLLFFLTGIFANFLAPYGYNEFHPGFFLKPPSAEFVLGTDNVGRDILSRIIYGARVSMIVGLVGASIDVAIGTIIGLISGYIGGRFDLIVQRFVDAFMCFPALLLIIVAMSLVGAGLWQVTLVIGITWGIGASRIVRGAVIAVKENVYVEAARAVGTPVSRILTRHILPNVTAPIIIIFTIAVGAIILTEASVSFLGYGIPPPMPSWGAMLSGMARNYMLTAPWMVIWPGLALSIVVYGINVFGDAVRDVLDPRLRGGIGRYGTAKAKKAR